MVIQRPIGNPYNGHINPYYWVDDHSFDSLIGGYSNRLRLQSCGFCSYVCSLENLCERTHFHQEKKIPTKISRICHGTKSSMKQTRVGPLPVINGVYNPYSWPYRWVFIGVKCQPPYKWSYFTLRKQLWTSAQNWCCWGSPNGQPKNARSCRRRI